MLNILDTFPCIIKDFSVDIIKQKKLKLATIIILMQQVEEEEAL